MAITDPTPNFKLNRPVFDKRTWSDDFYENMAIIDTILATTIAVNNFEGVWQNSTIYSVGDTLVDELTSELYEALIAHTSSSVSISNTFATERANNPTFWKDVSASALSAAASATAAAASAVEAAAQVVLAEAQVTLCIAQVALAAVEVGLAEDQVTLAVANVSLTNADVISTGNDVTTTGADTVSTAADVISAAASAVAAAASAATVSIDVAVADKQGTLIVQNAADDGFNRLALGTSGQFLKSGGDDAIPVYSDFSASDQVVLAAQVFN